MEFLRRLRFLITPLLALALTAQAAPPSPNEYALKAVFLYNVVRFVDWPASAFSSRKDPLVIGIVGPDPFGPLLYEAIAGETYQGRPITVAHYARPRDIRHCHLLFVGRANHDRLDQILAKAAGQTMLTVGETDYFLDHGGMIALTAYKNRVHLQINGTTLAKSRLGVSSKLLQVAQIRY